MCATADLLSAFRESAGTCLTRDQRQKSSTPVSAIERGAEVPHGDLRYGGSRMYGVPADLPIQAFVGHEANQICLGRFQVQLHFSGFGSIQMEGRWELRDPEGDLVDAAGEHKDRDSYRIHRIIDVPVAASIDPPRSSPCISETTWS
jgi:hypothetical protein